MWHNQTYIKYGFPSSEETEGAIPLSRQEAQKLSLIEFTIGTILTIIGIYILLKTLLLATACPIT